MLLKKTFYKNKIDILKKSIEIIYVILNEKNYKYVNNHIYIFTYFQIITKINDFTENIHLQSVKNLLYFHYLKI